MANREPAGATRTLRQECHEPDPDIARGESLNGHLGEYFPGFLAVVGVRAVCHPITRVLMAAAPPRDPLG